MVTMNDKVKVTMTLTQLTYLRSILSVYRYDHESQADSITRLISLLDDATDNLDYSENEALVDNINDRIKSQDQP